MTTNKSKIDMSPAAITARLKRACGLGDAERLATMIRSAIIEIGPEGQSQKQAPHKKKSKNER